MELEAEAEAPTASAETETEASTSPKPLGEPEEETVVPDTPEVIDEASDELIWAVEGQDSTSLVPVGSPLEPSEGEAASVIKVEPADMSETNEVSTKTEGDIPIWLILVVIAAALLPVTGLVFFFFARDRRSKSGPEAAQRTHTATSWVSV